MKDLVCDLFLAQSLQFTQGGSIADEGRAADTRPILEAITETAFYWSLVKVPAQVTLVAQAFPYAVSLINNSSQLHVAPKCQGQRWLRFGTLLFTILIIGVALLQAQKLDSYAFGQLVVAVAGKTVRLSPEWLRLTQRLVRISSEWLSTTLSSVGSVAPVSLCLPLPLAIIHHHFKGLTTSRHLRITTFIFLVDGMSQLPKRWSFIGRGSWGWAGGTLVVRAAMLLIDGYSEGEALERHEEGNTTAVKAEQVDDNPGEGYHRTIINAALQHCISSTLALCLASYLLPNGAVILDTRGNSARYFGILTLAWTSLWFTTTMTDASTEPIPNYLEQAYKISRAEAVTEGGSFKAKRWMGKLIMTMAVTPVVIMRMRGVCVAMRPMEESCR